MGNNIVRKLRVLYAEAATGYGGQERYLHRLMLQMRKRGHTVEMLCQPDAQLRSYLEQDGFVVHTVPMRKGLCFWKNLIKVTRFLRRNRYDIVNTTSRVDTLQVGLPARLAKVPLVVRSRHLARPIGSLLSYTWVPQRLITVSEFVRQQMLAKGINADHIGIVPPAVNLPDPLPQQKLRRELGLGEEDIVVGSIAVLRRPKGMGDLINAMVPLLQANACVHLVIVGDGELMPELRLQVKKVALEKQVHFMGERNDIAELIGDFDIFALATHIEASGTAFAEAGAARVPVVGTDVGGVSEMMDPNKSGLLVPLGDIPALTQALDKLVSDPELRARMGDEGYRYSILDKRFVLETMGEETEKHYTRWLKKYLELEVMAGKAKEQPMQRME